MEKKMLLQLSSMQFVHEGFYTFLFVNYHEQQQQHTHYLHSKMIQF